MQRRKKRVGISKEKLSWKDGLKGVDYDHLAGFSFRELFSFHLRRGLALSGEKNMYVTHAS
jgi:hypothetical protein